MRPSVILAASLGMLLLASSCAVPAREHGLFLEASSGSVFGPANIRHKVESVQGSGVEPPAGEAMLGYYLALPEETVCPRPRAGYPLYVFFHGASVFASDMFGGLKRQGRDHCVAVLLPEWEHERYGVSGDGALYRKIVHHVVSSQSLDPERVFLGGSSSGTLLARRLAFEEPKRYRGLIMASGASTGWQRKEVDYTQVPPVLFLHGWKDSRFRLVDLLDSIEFLVQEGVQVELVDEKSHGHGYRSSWTKKTFEWIDSRGVKSLLDS